MFPLGYNMIYVYFLVGEFEDVGDDDSDSGSDLQSMCTSEDLCLPALKYLQQCCTILASMWSMPACPIFNGAHRYSLSLLFLRIYVAFNGIEAQHREICKFTSCPKGCFRGLSKASLMHGLSQFCIFVWCPGLPANADQA